MGCKYQTTLGCVDCDVIRFTSCSKFRGARIQECVASLGAFVYSLGEGSVPCSEVCYSLIPQTGIRDCSMLYRNKEYSAVASRLKSMALWSGLHEYGGFPVIYMSMDTVVEVCFAYSRGDYEFARGVYFIEVWEGGIDAEKARTFLSSVISKVSSVGGRVFLLSSWVLPTLGFEWVRVVVNSPKSKCGRRVAKGVPGKGSGSKSVGSFMDEEGVL